MKPDLLAMLKKQNNKVEIHTEKHQILLVYTIDCQIQTMWETVIYRGEKSLLVLIYSSDSYNLGALVLF